MFEVNVINRVSGKRWNIKRLEDINVDIDLDMDADDFSFTINNYLHNWTGIINKFDRVEIYLNGNIKLRGIIDDVEHDDGESKNTMTIKGRDIISVLIDNDALPGTFYNVRPKEYITNKCSEYGIDNIVFNSDLSIEDKLIIGTNESEISIMKNLILADQKRLWFIDNTVYIGDWNTNLSPSYAFIRGFTDQVKSTNTFVYSHINYKDSGADLASEVRIYGSANDGKDKLMGTSKNDWLIEQGIQKRKVLRSYNDDSASKYSSGALKHIREYFRYGKKITIRLPIPNDPIEPDKTCIILDKKLKINSIFYIKGIRYVYNKTNRYCLVTMVLSDQEFDILWENQSSDVVNNSDVEGKSLQELLNSRRTE